MSIQSKGRRLIRLAKDTKDYWLEFRNNFTDDTLRNSLFLQWANPDLQAPRPRGRCRKSRSRGRSLCDHRR